MMTSRVWKSVDFTKTQKSRYLKNKTFFLQIKKIISYKSGATLGFKRNKHKCNFHYVVTPMITSEILKSAEFTKTTKSRYLENETLLHQIKEFITN